MKYFFLKTPVPMIKLPTKHPALLRIARGFHHASLKNTWFSAEFKRRHRRPEGQGKSSRKQEDE